jgi:hypothetical protein
VKCYCLNQVAQSKGSSNLLSRTRIQSLDLREREREELKLWILGSVLLFLSGQQFKGVGDASMAHPPYCRRIFCSDASPSCPPTMPPSRCSTPSPPPPAEADVVRAHRSVGDVEERCDCDIESGEEADLR